MHVGTYNVRTCTPKCVVKKMATKLIHWQEATYRLASPTKAKPNVGEVTTFFDLSHKTYFPRFCFCTTGSTMLLMFKKYYCAKMLDEQYTFLFCVLPLCNS